MAARQNGYGISGFLLAAGIALISTWATGLWPGTPFSRYIGALSPLGAVFLMAVSGTMALIYLQRAGQIGQDETAPGVNRALVITGLGLAFSVPTVLADIAEPWASDINVAPTQGVFFYTAIAFVVEVAFHLLPVALLYGTIALLWAPSRQRRLFWAAAVVPILSEPVFQILAGTEPGEPDWHSPYMAVHLTLFGLTEFVLLRRYGFWGMYGFRLTYYLIWHIVWGSLRLALLFPV